MIISAGGGGGLDCLGGLGGVHQDCNGKTPPSRHQTEQAGGADPPRQLRTDVFPQVNARSKDREDLDDDIEYCLCFRIQKTLEAYRPDWCESREDWSVFLFSPQNQ
ncbi:unnamed protein product [Pleuronectes platessa]|uniref:Uncharacterized protein n=1 Tax=Pleuronectes platessa TaxID=8262 RepID=A0A9N7UN51_PLEPL|nr:unnamed protein product [Pleuronectes platessa]